MSIQPMVELGSRSPLAKRLGALATLTAEHVAVLAACEGPPRRHQAGSDLWREGSAARVILSGWVGEGCVLGDGRRQFFALRIAGDVLERRTYGGETVAMALTPVVSAELPTVEERGDGALAR